MHCLVRHGDGGQIQLQRKVRTQVRRLSSTRALWARAGVASHMLGTVRLRCPLHKIRYSRARCHLPSSNLKRRKESSVDLSLGQSRLHWTSQYYSYSARRIGRKWSHETDTPQSTEVESHDSQSGRSRKLKPYSIGCRPEDPDYIALAAAFSNPHICPLYTTSFCSPVDTSSFSPTCESCSASSFSVGAGTMPKSVSRRASTVSLLKRLT